MVECMISNEIKDWFLKRINEECPDLKVRCLSTDVHYSFYKCIDIFGSKGQIMEAVKFIKHTRDILKYKALWVNQNSFYVDRRIHTAEMFDILERYKDNITYMCTRYIMIGVPITVFNFTPFGNNNIRNTIDEIFRSRANLNIEFIVCGKTIQEKNLLLYSKSLKYLKPEIAIPIEIFSERTNNDEVQSLSQKYNIEFDFPIKTHIDFKPKNKSEIVHFCAIYHYDPHQNYFLNYEPKHPTQNYEVHFSSDDTLEPIECSNDFSTFILKSNKSCLSQNINSVLKYVVENFMPCVNGSTLILVQFDLNQVPHSTIMSLFNLMLIGWLRFEEANISFETFSVILQHSSLNNISFAKCCITFDNIRPFCYYSEINQLEFCNMDIDVAVFGVLNRITGLEIKNCRVFSTSWQSLLNIKVSEDILFSHCNLDPNTILKLLQGISTVRRISFLSCCITPSDCIDRKYFIFDNIIQFIDTAFEIHTLFDLFKYCEFQNRIVFKSCDLYNKIYGKYVFPLRPVHIEFKQINFDSLVLIKILKTLHSQSTLIFEHCSISFSNEDISTTDGLINIKSVKFLYCQQLLSNLVHWNAQIKVSHINFSDMTLKFINILKILEMLEETSSIKFCRCEIILPATYVNLVIRSKHTKITFDDMEVASDIVYPFLQTDIVIEFIKCRLNFMNPDFADIFDRLATNIIIKPRSISFIRIILKLDKLLTFLERVSDNTEINIDQCNIHLDDIYSIRPNQISKIFFKNMNLEVETILYFLKNFTNLLKIYFGNCTILCSNELPNIMLKTKALLFENIDIDFQIFSTLVKRCTEDITICINNSKIALPRNKVLSPQLPLQMERLVIMNIDYSSDLLQILQCLTERCIVEYHGQLSNREIGEMIKILVNGSRLILATLICTKSIYYELFVEHFRRLAENFEIDSESEYNLPFHLIPQICSLSGDTQIDWSIFRVKVMYVNDVVEKIEFIKNGKPIDLFYELNNLPDDSNQCIVNYY